MIKIFFHICTITIYEELVKYYLDTLIKSKILEDENFYNMNVCIVGDYYDNVIDIFNSMVSAEIMNKIIFHKDKNDGSESPTFNIMYSDIISDDREFYILYLHSKGVTRVIDGKILPSVQDWIDLMTYFNITKYKDCIKKLQNGYNAIGVHLRPKTETHPIHFGGNFWWTTSLYMKLREKPLINTDRFYYEFWLCNDERAKPYSFHDMTVNPYDERYPKEKYET